MQHKHVLNTAPSASSAILLMVFYGLCMAVSDSMAKELGVVYPVLIIVWYRYIFHALTMLVLRMILLRQAGYRENIGSHGAQVIRGLVLVLSTLAFFNSLVRLPLAEAMSLLYIFPVIAVVLSIAFLRERIDLVQGLLLLVIFCGVLLIFNPGGRITLGPGLYGVIGGVLMGLYLFLTKAISREATPVVSSLYGGAVGIVVVPFFPGFEFQLLQGPMLVVGILVGIVAAIGHFSMFQSMRSASAVIVAPFAYMEVVFAAVIGYFWFNDDIEAIAYVGIILVIAGGILLGTRNQGESRA